MNLTSITSRRQGTLFSRLPSIQPAILSVLLACFAIGTAASSARAVEPADFSLLSPQNALLRLLTPAAPCSITIKTGSDSWNDSWGRSTLSGRAAAYFMSPSESIPVDIFSTPSTVSSNSNVSTSVSVDQTGSYVQVGCDHPSLLTSPSGSWPYNVNFPSGGSNSQAVTINTGAVSSNTTVKIYACQAGMDINNPNNWQAINTITVTP